MRFNNTSQTSADPPSRRKRLDELTLPRDIDKSLPPFVTKHRPSVLEEDSRAKLGWKDVILGVNVVTQTVFPLFHMFVSQILASAETPRCCVISVSDKR